MSYSTIDSYFTDMPSLKMNEDFRTTSVSYEDFSAIFMSDVAQDLMKKYGVKVGMNKSCGVTLIMPSYSVNYEDDSAKFQEFINELDKQTVIFNETIWSGNCGKFADKIVYRGIGCVDQTYIRDKSDYDFQTFYMVFDYTRRFPINQKFIYKEYSPYSWRIKNNKITTSLKYENLKNEILDYVNKIANENGCNIEPSVGKSQVDSSSYEAFIVYRGNTNNVMNQIGRFSISQNEWGDCKVKVNRILCGSYSTELNLENYEKELIDIVNEITK